jgi:hypothetical protein
VGYIIKTLLTGAGLTAIYGLATGADLDVLFANILAEALPVITNIVAGVSHFVNEVLNVSHR